MNIWQTRARSFVFFYCLAILAHIGGCQPAKNQYIPRPPIEVHVMQPIMQTVTHFIEENGVAEAVEEAEVRSRVRGFVEEIAFQPGAEVQAGDVLYRIEQDQYAAAKNSAEATLRAADAAIKVAESMVQTSEAELTRLAREFERQKELIVKKATSQAEYDSVAAAYTSAAASLRSSKASVEAAIAEKGKAAANLAQANLDFDYTIVRAPIDGHITKTDIKLGNLVENGTVLASIIDDRRIYANFNVNDRELLRLRKAKEAELKPGEELEEVDLSKYRVFLHRETDEGFPFEGRLEYADRQGVDSRTGTLAMRAIFENPREDLLPGLFVRVRVPVAQREAILIPELAIGRDQLGDYALTVDKQDQVQRTSIKIAKKLAGWVVVQSGLTTEDRVIFSGMQWARPGTTVSPQLKELSVSDESLTRELAEKQPAQPATTAPAAE